MKKVYISKIDNMKFSTKEELTKYLMENYTLEGEDEGDVGEIHEKLQKAFPFAHINVKSNEDGRNRDYGEYLVNMIWDEYEAEFDFYIGNHVDYDYYYRSYNKVEDAIESYNVFITKNAEITTKLQNTYNPDEITVGQMYEGDMHGNDGIYYSVSIDGNSYFGRYEFGEVDEFVSSFRGYFDRVIEGAVIRRRNHANGYDYDPTIGGVPFETILKRAKKLRIEILEEVNGE